MISCNSLDLYESCHSYLGGLSHECKTKLHQVHLQEWAARFTDQKASGLTVRQWCEVNHFSFHTYNYWKHLLKEEVVEQALPDIVPIAVPTVPDSNSSLEVTGVSSIRSNQSTVELRINGFCIESDISVSAEFLSKLLKAVRYA